MFEIAGVRAVSALLTVSLAVLLGACVHPTPPDSAGPKSWVVENVASKTTQELYADVIAPGVFERSSSKVIDGYTVESGNLRMPDKSVGSLVTVRSTDGSLLAAVEEPGKNGWLVVSRTGESRFTPNPAEDYSLPDTRVEKTKPVESKSSITTAPYVIDMLVGFSRSAVVVGGGDATANALALVEGINLALRNSQVSNVSIKLVGVQVIEQNYPIIGDTLDKVPELFSTGIREFGPDLVIGVFGGHPDDNAGGYGWMPGRFAIGHNSVEVIRHEVGHNAGGLHCSEWGGGLVPYGYGYENGKTFTAQCWNTSPYYSTPAVRDAYGLPIGDVATADMARVWRENAERLSSYYSVATPTNFKKTGSTLTKVTFGWSPSSDAVRYDMYRTVLSGTEVVKIAETTNLTHTVSDTSGRTIYYVKAVDAIGKESNLSNGASR